MLKASHLYCHQLGLIQQVCWISKKFLERATCQSGTPRNSPSPVLSSLPWALFPPPLLKLSNPVCDAPSWSDRFDRLQGSTPWATERPLWRLAVPAAPRTQAAPGPRRADSLPRRLRRSRRARPSPRAGCCSLSLSAALRPPRAQPLQPGRRRLSTGSAPPRTATASLQSPHDAGHCRFHQDGLCVEQLEKSGYSLYFSNACLRRTGTLGPGLGHCTSFHLWDLCMLYLQELSLGGSKLVMSKIK